MNFERQKVRRLLVQPHLLDALLHVGVGSLEFRAALDLPLLGGHGLLQLSQDLVDLVGIGVESVLQLRAFLHLLHFKLLNLNCLVFAGFLSTLIQSGVRLNHRTSVLASSELASVALVVSVGGIVCHDLAHFLSPSPLLTVFVVSILPKHSSDINKVTFRSTGGTLLAESSLRLLSIDSREYLLLCLVLGKVSRLDLLVVTDHALTLILVLELLPNGLLVLKILERVL